jgi:hypothetical protein
MASNQTDPQPEDDEPDPREIRLAAIKSRSRAILKSHVAQLMEHFDSVQIFCSYHSIEDEVTMPCHRGDGNWYARYGPAKEWVTQQEEQMRIDQRGD